MILSAVSLTLLGGEMYSQNKKAENDYNLQKAREVLNEEKDEAKAMALVNTQLGETPDMVEALLLRVRLNRMKGEYGAALHDLNHALKVNKPNNSGITNATLHWWKGHVYQDMFEMEKAVDSFRTAYELAVKGDKENCQGIAFDYAQSLYLTGDLGKSDIVYREMLRRDESDVEPMVGLARNMEDRGQYREALELLEKAGRMEAGYGEVYRFKMVAHNRLNELSKAVDDGLDWYEKSDNPNIDSLMVVLVRKAGYAVASIKSREKKSENPAEWKMLLCDFYEHTRDFAAAVKGYDELEEMYGKHEQIHIRRSDAYSELGLYDRAIEDASAVVEKNRNVYSLCRRGDCYRQSGRLEEALADFSAAIEEDPKAFFPYYHRGWVYEMMGDRKKAMDDYNLGIEMKDDVPYLYLMRGELRLAEGDRPGAEADFQEVLERDTLVNGSSCRMYALHFLGRDREAEEWMRKMIASDPSEPGNYYDQACLFSHMGRLEESVAALRTALEKGYRSFAHIRQDDDLDPIRTLPAYKELMKEYEAKHAEYLKQFELTAPVRKEVVSEISMARKSGGTFEIPCHINGLPLKMIFDTGATDVTISSVEANFMMKNGYLSPKDVKGKKYYQIANGEISAGTVITLREVKVGDVVLKNVDASVVKSQNAPLLLGQSAMERFGTITIDNINGKLVIKH